MLEYNISQLPPPVYKKAQEKFGVDFYKGIVFTYGNTIHVANGKLSPDLLVHELVHVKQQAEYPGGKEAWWDRYFEDNTFRFDQEIEAYQAQYRKVCMMTKDRNKRYKDLLFFAKSLMWIYRLDDLDWQDLMKQIKNEK